ncbi:GGDEF domain-containing protein [Pararhizobium haloflavum]|uniref:GGDEF domain-containing protein n=1 Tax=Pararhizobium haloflavum TaxID=2037914 RepID=UPI000C196C10|nr:GGDEF domain-containing protein [Pararhizobium haloflavum]
MRLHKAELFFFLLVVFIGLTGFYSWGAFRVIDASMQDGGRVALDGIYRQTFLSAMFAGLSIVCSVFLVYPMIWRGLREQGELRRMTATLSARSETLEYAAVTDPLTGLFNRRYFDDALAEYLNAFHRIEKPLGMILIDIDHFKQVNDTHGHDIGDEVLRQIAACLAEFTRYHDVVARLGGEEFAVLSPNVSNAQLYGLADRIRNAIGTLTVRTGNVTLRITVSAGVALWDGKEDGDQLYKRADSQLYEAKRQGRNRVCA